MNISLINIKISSDIYARIPNETDIISEIYHNKVGMIAYNKVNDDGKVEKKTGFSYLNRNGYGDIVYKIFKNYNIINIFLVDNIEKKKHDILNNIIGKERVSAQVGNRYYIINDSFGNSMFIEIRKTKKTFNSFVYYKLKSMFPNAQIDWNLERLIPGFPVKSQAFKRVDFVKKELSQLMTSESHKLERALLLEEEGDIIINLALRDAGSLSLTNFSDANKRLIKMIIETYRFASDNSRAMLHSKKMPIIFFNDKYLSAKSNEDIMKKTKSDSLMQRHLTGFGKNKQAAIYVRNRNFNDGFPVNLYNGKLNAYPNDFLSINEGETKKLLFNSFRTRSDWQKMANDDSSENFTPIARTRLNDNKQAGMMWRRTPDQVGLILSILKGHFLPI